MSTTPPPPSATGNGPDAAGPTGPAGADAPVVLVSGAARGIGAATARHLARDGWRVALLDGATPEPALGYALSSADELHRTVATCGPDAFGVVADVRDQAALDAAVSQVVDRFGRLDAVVSAAGAIAGGATVWETGDDVWDAMVDINLTGPFRLVRAAVPHLLARPAPRQGRVVVIASAASVGGLPRLGAYSAAKHGVIGLVRSLAVELAPAGITANAVCPGSTRTTMLEASAAVYDLDSVEVFAGQQPVGRLLEPEEIAAAVAWLCQPAAAGVTGAVLPVDGGMTAS